MKRCINFEKFIYLYIDINLTTHDIETNICNNERKRFRFELLDCNKNIITVGDGFFKSP